MEILFHNVYKIVNKQGIQHTCIVFSIFIITKKKVLACFQAKPESSRNALQVCLKCKKKKKKKKKKGSLRPFCVLQSSLQGRGCKQTLAHVCI